MEPRDDEALLRGIHSGLEVLKAQQSEIYRRMGKVENKLDGLSAVVGDIEKLNTRLSAIEGRRYATITHIWGAFLTAVGGAIAVAGLGILGLPPFLGSGG